MKKILITGGSGFIGRNLAESLQDRYEVFAPSRKELDLLDPEGVRQYLMKHSFDVVIHSANTKNTFDHLKLTDYQVLFRNLKMYCNLSQCEGLYDKMYYFGSGAEFDTLHYIPYMSEEYFGTFIPNDPYGFSKYIMNLSARRSNKVFNLRLFGVYGKYEEWNRRFLSNNMCRVLKGLDISINQDMQFDYLYVEDLCRLMCWFIEHTPKYHDYNVCSGISIRLSDIASLLHERCGSRLPIRIREDGSKLPYTADNSRMLAELGPWHFTDISLGIDRLWAYYLEKYKTDPDFRIQLEEHFSHNDP